MKKSKFLFVCFVSCEYRILFDMKTSSFVKKASLYVKYNVAVKIIR